jgi:hypothetical protein
MQFFAPGFTPERGYLKNRLRFELRAGKKYCAKIHLNSAHNCMYSIDGIGMYFGGTEIDSFAHPNSAMPTINPQIELSYMLFDTVSWVPLTGTFVANGNEKYLVIGCFKPNSAVNYSLTPIQPLLDGPDTMLTMLVVWSWMKISQVPIPQSFQETVCSLVKPMMTTGLRSNLHGIDYRVLFLLIQ